MKSKKGQQISINFLVVFIMSVVIFSLGIMLMWKIFYSGGETLDISQGEFDKKISALNCKPTEVVCIGTNSLEFKPGENILVAVRVFNNHNFDNYYSIDFEIRDENNEVYFGEGFELLPSIYKDSKILTKDEKEFLVLINSDKKITKGNYVLRVSVIPDGLDSIPKRVNIKIV